MNMNAVFTCTSLTSSAFPRTIRRASLASLMVAVCLIAVCKHAVADIGATHSGLVSEFASFNTPGVVDGRVEAIAVDGDTVYVGGNFTQIQEPLGGDVIDQPYLFAYSKASGSIIRNFDPVLNNRVLALETTGEGNGVFAAGTFGVLNGEAGRRGLVKIDSNGDRVRGFGARPNKMVQTLVRLDNTLYVGGLFDKISGVAVENLAAVDTVTGALSPYLNLDFDGPIPSQTRESTQSVDDIDITSDGRLLVVAGNFTGIDGLSRTRLAAIALQGQARVSNWNTDVFTAQCPSTRALQYVYGIDISPDDTYLVVGTSGHIIRDNPACDGITRFELTDLNDADVQPTWANFATDSVYDVVSTGHAVYTGGHFRLLNNSVSMNGGIQGPGAILRRGLAALDPRNGLTLQKWRSDRSPRGRGTFALISEEEGLYIGDDTDSLNGTEHPKLKFLPITTNTITRHEAPSLPSSLLTLDNNMLNSVSYDGTSFSEATALSTNWANAQAGMVVGGQFFHADNNGTLWVSAKSNSSLGTPTEVDMRGLTSEQWQLASLGGMFFDPEFGRVYYTKQGSTQLFYRYFTPDGVFFGEKEYIAEQQGDIAWGSVSGMDVIDGHLYFGLTDGNLYRAQINGAAVVPGTALSISGPAIDGLRWDNNLLAFYDGSFEPPTTGEEFRFGSSGTETDGRWQVFNFTVNAGELVSADVTWNDPNADVRVFLRDQDRQLVVRDTNGLPAQLSTIAETGGRWSIAVQIRSGAVDYNIVVTTSSEFEPRPDIEFVSSGSATEGAWQVFKFNVEPGEQVDAEVVWDDPLADVKLYLRDENNTQIDRNTQSIGSGTLSALAANGGRWSVAVRIASGSINFTIAINIQPGADADGDGVSDLTDAFPNDATESVDSDRDGIGDNADGSPFGEPVLLSDGNIALGRPASQSSTVSGGVASRAVDGITDGRYANASVTHTLNNRNAWWQVDLGRSANIGLIRLFNRTEVSGRLSDVHLFVSDLDMSGRNVSELLNDPEVGQAFIEGPAGAMKDIENIGRGRYVKIQLDGTNSLTLAEVQVFEAILPENLALAKPATQSSTGLNGVASRAVDGNTDGAFANNSVTATFADVNAWWQVDLGRSVDMGLVRIFNRTEVPERLSNVHVFASDSDMSGRSLSDLLNDPSVDKAFIDGQAGAMTALENVGSGRYLKIQLAVADFLSLAEVQVYEGVATRNIALAKPAAQSSNHDTIGAASNAVDGNTDGVYANYSVTHTSSDVNAWWQVDLGASNQMGLIRIFNRVKVLERLSNVHVFASESDMSGRSLSELLNDPAVNKAFIEGQAGPSVDVENLGSGRYLKIQLVGSNWLSLAEVQVYRIGLQP